MATEQNIFFLIKKCSGHHKGRGYKGGESSCRVCEPVWPRGKAGERKDLGLIPLRFSFLFKKVVVCGQSCDFVHHSIKMALIAAHLNAGIILVVTV